MPTRARLAVLAALVALLAAACATGGDDAETASTTTTTTTTTSTTAVPEGAIVVGVDGAFALTSFGFNYDEFVPISREETYVTQSFGRFQAPERLECTVAQGIRGPEGERIIGAIRTVTIGTDVWIDEGEGWQQVSNDDPRANFARAFCAQAWNTKIDDTPPLDILDPPIEFEGIQVRHADLAQLGVPLGDVFGEGYVVQRFEVWLAVDGFWPAAFVIEAVGPAPDVAARIEREYDGPQDDLARMVMQGALRAINDPSIQITPPDVDGS